MDYKKELEKVTSSLGKDLKKMTQILDANLATIPGDKMQEIAPMRSDINRILDSVKSGDVDAINEITKKYANISR